MKPLLSLKPIILMLWLQIWDAINDGTIFSCPSLLSSFIVLSYADLKKYKFHYWFAFPALHSDSSWVPLEEDGKTCSTNVQTRRAQAKPLPDVENLALAQSVKDWARDVDARQRGFFLARRDKAHDNNYAWTIAALSSFENGFFGDAHEEDCFICFADPSNYDEAPGWMLRNLLALINRRWALTRAQILRYCTGPSQRDCGRNVVISLCTKTSQTSETQATSDEMPKVTGWERNPAGKLAGRFVDLKEYLDPKR